MKLIKLNPDHYVVVDGHPTGGTYYLDDTNAIRKGIICDRDYWAKRPEYRKITHSTQPIEYDRVPGGGWNEVGYQTIKELSLSEVKAIIGEVDVEKKIYGLCQSECIVDAYGKPTDDGMVIGIRAYNQSLEDNKEKRYTEEDVIKAIRMTRGTDTPIEVILKSIQPQTEWEVEFVDGKLKLK